MIVIDTNIIAYLYLTSERTKQAEETLRKDPIWAAPILWRSEFRNVLAFYLRQRILSFNDTLEILSEAERLMHGKEYEVSSVHVMRLVESSGCSAYDCEFVALAEDLQIPLITVDKKVLSAFNNMTIALDKFVK